MAILPMKKIYIYGLKRDRKPILEELQRRGIVEMIDEDIKKVQCFKEDTNASQATFNKAVAVAENAIDILEGYIPEEKSMFEMFSGRKNLSKGNYYTFVEEIDEIIRVAGMITTLSKEVASSKDNIIRNEALIEGLKPWLPLDVPISYKGTKKTTALIGSFTENKDAEVIHEEYLKALEKLEYNKDDLAIDIEIISKSTEQTCVFIVCLTKDALKVEEVLRNIGFAKPISVPKRIPSEEKDILEKEIEKLKQSISKKENQIRSYVGMRNALKFAVDYYTMRMEKYDVLSKLNQMKRTFILTGYIPEKDAHDIEKEFSYKYNVGVEIEEVPEDEQAPILLQNNNFAAPVETVLETYSMPGKGEIDPSFIMAIFYYVLFGLMLSDAAYGLLMVLGCGFVLAKFKNIEDGLKKSIKMFLYCGISTIFWGVMFGGYFGDAITVVSSTFFGKEIIIPPAWFAPIDDPMRMLVFSFAVGIVHLFTGLAVQFYQLCKRGKFIDAIYDVVFWYLLVGGAIVYLLTVPMFIQMTGLTFMLSKTAGMVATICAVIGALGIILTGGRESRNPVKRLLKGAYALYNVTGYLSDILSYSRLLALGLATGVIANVFNKMGSMMGNGAVGFILFIIVFIIGHSLNIGINLLGAYVHTNRLQFVEFFGKFYEGGGRKYKPYAANTKYFKIKE